MPAYMRHDDSMYVMRYITSGCYILSPLIPAACVSVVWIPFQHTLQWLVCLVPPSVLPLFLYPQAD